MAAYRYEHGGQELGPVSAAELRALAAAGMLLPSDVVWQEGSTQRLAASKVKGLFPTADPAAPEPSTTPPPEATKPGVKELGAAARQKLEVAKARLQPWVDRYSREFEIEPRPLIAAALGCLALLVLVLAALMTWESYSSSVNMPIAGSKSMVNEESYTGVTYFEGKAACVLALLGLAGIAAAFFVKKWFAASLLLAAGVATCAFLLVFAYYLKIERYVAKEQRNLSTFNRNMGVNTEAKYVADQMNMQFNGGASFGLFLALMAALGGSLAFAFASWRKPQPLPFLEKQGAGPFLVRHGGLIGAMGIGLLVGLIVYIANY